LTHDRTAIKTQIVYEASISLFLFYLSNLQYSIVLEYFIISSVGIDVENL